jgi:hypothetical protein
VGLYHLDAKGKAIGMNFVCLRSLARIASDK